ncbi:MAG: hypothetical protein ACI94Y_003594 [Maribacter sp.]|jgi:hypothetical protein
MIQTLTPSFKGISNKVPIYVTKKQNLAVNRKWKKRRKSRVTPIY